MLPGKVHQDQLKEMKKNVEMWHDYFKENVDRYHSFKKFIFKTSITNEVKTKLDELGKPPLEANMLEAYISRLLGEFLKHEPDIISMAADGVRTQDLTEKFLAQLDCVQAHLKEIFFNGSNDSLDYELYRDGTSGGFSVAGVFTDYVNEMSFEQNIRVSRVFDPTLTFFDPMARESHKGDGEFCGMITPMTKAAFEHEFGKEALDGITFTRNSGIGGFNWSYKTQAEEIVLVAEYYYKKKKKEKIVKLSNGHVVLKKHYQDFLDRFQSQGFIEQAPIIISERETVIETIIQKKFCENRVLSHQTTNFKYLPLVFFDGNSVTIRENEGGSSCQMVRPIVYHAKGTQELINFAMQTQAAEIENMVMHKIKIPIEGIPEGYMDVYKNVQIPSTMVYNQFYKDNPDVRLDPPQEIQRTQTPPIVENTFMGGQTIIQQCIGSYDSVLATNDKQVSGVSIQQGALQSNAAALPYLKGYIRGLSRVAQIVVDLIPKYYVTPRSLPIRQRDGKRSYQMINNPDDPNSIDMNYNPNNFNIKVEPGVSTGVQKQVAIEQITRMTQANEVFANFINTKGLETILDNLDIRGIENLKALAAEFMQQQAEAAEKAAQEGDPMMKIEQEKTQAYVETEMAKVEQQAEKAQGELAIQAAKVANEKQATDIKFMEAMAKIEREALKLDIEQERIDSENARSAVGTAIEMARHMHERRESERGDE